MLDCGLNNEYSMYVELAITDCLSQGTMSVIKTVLVTLQFVTSFLQCMHIWLACSLEGGSTPPLPSLLKADAGGGPNFCIVVKEETLLQSTQLHHKHNKLQSLIKEKKNHVIIEHTIASQINKL